MTKIGSKVDNTKVTIEEYSEYDVTIGKICRFCNNAEPLSIISLPYGTRIWCNVKLRILENYYTCDGFDIGGKEEEVIEEE